ncbi:general secretion pathway protein L [Yersinia pekkanenii]|uniref:General secretion pathway protein L n=2 Tax=Yersinia pekkanenii TaxID=1288385 RepID=A0A0T9P8Z6_9GAMM|nr:general secretion pathway protein L [Yersinia pekkanenii]
MINIMNRDVSQGMLLIRLGSYVSDPIYWYMIMHDGNNSKYGKLENHTELKNISIYFNYKVKVLVSANHIIFRRLDVKNIKIKKNIKTIEFLIEKTIFGNIDNFHIINLKCDGDFCYIAAVECELMNLWLGWLTRANIYAEVMMPDVLTLPFSDGKWSAFKLNNEWLIRKNEMSGFSVSENILEKIYSSGFFSSSMNTFISSNNKKISWPWPTTKYCEVLRIMAKNIEGSDVNFLSGKYNHHKVILVDNNYIFRVICLCLILSTVICLNYLFDKYKIEKDIDVLNHVSQGFYNNFAPENKDHLNKESDFIEYVSNYNVKSLEPDFFSLLYSSGHIFSDMDMDMDMDMDIDVNNIYFERDQQTISFNTVTIGSGVKDKVLEGGDEKLKRFNISISSNDDGTHDIVFKFIP